MKFKVGDKVRVKKNLITGESYGGVHFRSTMCKYLGLETSIARVVSEGNYYLEGCGSWNFSDDMLKPIENKEEKEKTSLAKALELLNMTEEEMLKEYAKTKEDKLVDEMIEKFDEFCESYSIENCQDCKYAGKKNCKMRFAMDFLREKGLLKEDK